MRLVLEIVLIVLAADFVTGFVHWLEDSYGSPEWPLIGKHVIEPNILHHHQPTAFTENSWFESARVPLALGAVALSASAALGALSWQQFLFVAISVNANEVHKWNHLPKRKRGWLVNGLQKLRILQTQKHHAKHHGGAKNVNYCVITNLLNPVLETIGFWRTLERAIELVLGVKKRHDPSVPAKFQT